MDRIPTALSISSKQARARALVFSVPTEEDPRIERMALNREFFHGRGWNPRLASRLTGLPARKRRIVSHHGRAGGGPWPTGCCARRVLQRARTHGLSTLGVVSAINGEG